MNRPVLTPSPLLRSCLSSFLHCLSLHAAWSLSDRLPLLVHPSFLLAPPQPSSQPTIKIKTVYFKTGLHICNVVNTLLNLNQLRTYPKNLLLKTEYSYKLLPKHNRFMHYINKQERAIPVVALLSWIWDALPRKHLMILSGPWKAVHWRQPGQYSSKLPTLHRTKVETLPQTKDWGDMTLNAMRCHGLEPGTERGH